MKDISKEKRKEKVQGQKNIERHTEGIVGTKKIREAAHMTIKDGNKEKRQE